MKITLVGFGKSNIQLSKRLCGLHEIFVSERRNFTTEELEIIERCGFGYEEHHTKRLLDTDIIVVSPGISPFSEVGKMIIESGKRATSDISIFFGIFQPSGKIIGVTGTNGKTTTTRMIDHFLKKKGLRTCLCGNNERPVSDLKDEVDFIVLELSSFQLFWTDNLKVDVGLILNIAPDHVDWHRSFEHYRSSKMKLVKFSKKIFFAESLKENPENVPEHLKSPQNLQNVAGAMVVLKELGFDERDFLKSLRDFRIPPHRLEYVGVINGIEFYDDSKATNTHAVIKALENFNKVTLIISGIIKEEDLRDFVRILNEKTEAVVMLGEEISRKMEGLDVPHFFAKSMDEAVRTAYKVSRKVVLLSPGGASFDMYKNYEERGDDFKRAVLELMKSGV